MALDYTAAVTRAPVEVNGRAVSPDEKHVSDQQLVELTALHRRQRMLLPKARVRRLIRVRLADWDSARREWLNEIAALSRNTRFERAAGTYAFDL